MFEQARKQIISVLVVFLLTACYTPLLHAKAADTIGLSEKERLSMQLEYQNMDWKKGLPRPSENKDSAPHNKEVAPYTDSVKYKQLIRKSEIHYYSFETTIEGMVGLRVTGDPQAPHTFITDPTGSMQYEHGNKLPAGKYILVITGGDISHYTVTLNGLSFLTKPDTTLPKLTMIKPRSETNSVRLSSKGTCLTFEGTHNAKLLTFGIYGSDMAKVLPKTFKDTVTISSDQSVYHYYEFQAESTNGNKWCQIYEVILPRVLRIEGKDRYGVAVNTSQQLHPGTAKSVILTRGDSAVDAISGGVLSGLDGAPILLTPSTKLPSNVLNELKRLQPENVYIVGGTHSVSASIEQEIKNLGYTVVRLDKGANRYDVSAHVAEYFTEKLNERGVTPSTALVVNGSFLANGAQGLAIAIEKGLPILYINKDSVPASVDAFIKKHPQYTHFVILDDASVISDAVKTRIQSYDHVKMVKRVGPGLNRFNLGLDMIRYFKIDPKTLVFGRGDTATTTGEIYPDAVVGAPLAAKYKGAALLTQPQSMHDSIRKYLTERQTLGNKIDQVFIQGSSNGISGKQGSVMYQYVE